MSPKSPRLTARQMEKALLKLGFSVARQSGSHRIFVNFSGVRATLPVHAGKILHPKIVAAILRDADITVELLREML